MLGLYTTTQYRALESQYKKAEKLIKELQEKIEDLRLKSESSQLLVDYNELKIAHQALVSKEAIESKTIEALDSIVQDHKTKMASLKPESSSTTASVIESKAKITDVAREVNKYRDEIKSLQDKVIALGKERDDLSTNYTSTLAKIENLSKDTTTAQLTAAKVEKRNRELEEINKSLSKSNNDLKQENENLSKDKVILTTKEAVYKNRIAELEAEVERLLKEAKNAKTIEGSTADPSKGEVVTVRVKNEDPSVVFKANGEVIKDFVQLYKGSSVTIECYKDGKLTDSFIVEEN